ncbi:MAG: cation:proton antiporter [Bacteriovoracaceae bacterium]
MDLIKEFTLYLQNNELTYVFLIILLYIIPRLLFRMGIPLGLGAFIVGFISSNLLNIFITDPVIPTFSLLGISSLFLYAGLEVNFNELRSNSKALILNILVIIIMIGIFIYLSMLILSLDLKLATIISLAIITPSTGFILDSLPGSNISEEQKMWVKLMAISSEMVALLLLVIIQANSPLSSILTIVTIVLLSIALPYIFQWVTRKVEINNSGSDLSFVLLLAVVIGTITKKMGAYYLVGAFLVGFTVNFYQKTQLRKPMKISRKTARFFCSIFYASSTF